MVHYFIISRQLKQIKGLELISAVELAFGSSLTGAISMKSKEISMRVKETIIRLMKKEYINLRDSRNLRRG